MLELSSYIRPSLLLCFLPSDPEAGKSLLTSFSLSPWKLLLEALLGTLLSCFCSASTESWHVVRAASYFFPTPWPHPGKSGMCLLSGSGVQTVTPKTFKYPYVLGHRATKMNKTEIMTPEAGTLEGRGQVSKQWQLQVQTLQCSF